MALICTFQSSTPSLKICILFFTQYALVKDVVSSLKKHRMHEQQFTHHPLLILNNFGVDGMQVKLMATMFQNMFPSINVHKVCPVNNAGAMMHLGIIQIF